MKFFKEKFSLSKVSTKNSIESDDTKNITYKFGNNVFSDEKKDSVGIVFIPDKIDLHIGYFYPIYILSLNESIKKIIIYIIDYSLEFKLTISSISDFLNKKLKINFEFRILNNSLSNISTDTKLVKIKMLQRLFSKNDTESIGDIIKIAILLDTISKIILNENYRVLFYLGCNEKTLGEVIYRENYEKRSNFDIFLVPLLNCIKDKSRMSAKNKNKTIFISDNICILREKIKSGKTSPILYNDIPQIVNRPSKCHILKISETILFRKMSSIREKCKQGIKCFDCKKNIMEHF